MKNRNLRQCHKLLWLALLVLMTCQQDDSSVGADEYFKTVDPSSTVDFYNDLKTRTESAGFDESFIVSVDGDYTLEDITNSDEELTVIPVTTNYSQLQSRVLLLEIEGVLQSVVYSWFDKGSEGDIFNGIIFISDVDGHLLKRLVMINNQIVHEEEYETTEQTTNSFADSTTTPDTCENGCPKWDNAPCDHCDLPEMIIYEPVEIPPPPYVSITSLYAPIGGSRGCEINCNGWHSGGGGGNAGSFTCPPGKIEIAGDCFCPEGMVENQEGECVQKPCEGDPVLNPEIAPQLGSSGPKGGLFGCVRYGGGCSDGVEGRNKPHYGIDILNEYGSPIHALYDGVVHSVYHSEGTGYALRVRSVLPDGEIIIYQYFHLKLEGRLEKDTSVSAGSIIGFQGDSGNLKGAIADGSVESHVHIRIGTFSGSGNSYQYSNFDTINPADYLGTTFDENNNPINNDCQ